MVKGAMEGNRRALQDAGQENMSCTIKARGATDMIMVEALKRNCG